MSKANQKIKKLSSVIKVRERELNYSRNELAQTRRDKTKMLIDLSNSQKRYMKSVDDLNKLRMLQTSDAETLALESSIEYVRNKWADQLSDVRTLERQERIQLVMVQDLQAKLKAVEIINEKYLHEVELERARNEQTHLDEFVNNRYAR